MPELDKYPAGIIYEPWKATLSAQREYGCVLGVDYPHRIVNHDIVHKENIKRMGEAYKVNREVRTGKAEDDYDGEQKPQASGKRKASSKAAGSVSKRRR